MMQGAFFFPCSNRSRTRLAPTPTNISTKSEPEMEKNGTLASPAIARARRVLPVPGEPIRSTPLGMRPPSFWNFCGSRRDSMISCSSSLASSTSATSLNVTFFCCEECSRARLLPKLSALLPPLCICRIMKIQKPNRSTNGIAFTRIETQFPPLSFSTLNCTPRSSSRVVKSLYVGGTIEWNSSPFLYFPWMSPVLLLKVTLSIFPSFTCWTSSENCGCAPGGLLFLNTAHTSTTRHRMINQRTALLTLEFMKSPQLLRAYRLYVYKTLKLNL